MSTDIASVGIHNALSPTGHYGEVPQPLQLRSNLPASAPEKEDVSHIRNGQGDSILKLFQAWNRASDNAPDERSDSGAGVYYALSQYGAASGSGCLSTRHIVDKYV